VAGFAFDLGAFIVVVATLVVGVLEGVSTRLRLRVIRAGESEEEGRAASEGTDEDKPEEDDKDEEDEDEQDKDEDDEEDNDKDAEEDEEAEIVGDAGPEEDARESTWRRSSRIQHQRIGTGAGQCTCTGTLTQRFG